MNNYFFKARIEWVDTILEMSDEEAGIFAKALWAWSSGNAPIPEIPTDMKMFYRMAISQLISDNKAQRELSVVRAQSGRKGAEKTNSIRRQMLAANADGKSRQMPAANSADIRKDIDTIPPTPLSQIIKDMIEGGKHDADE